MTQDFLTNKELYEYAIKRVNSSPHQSVMAIDQWRAKYENTVNSKLYNLTYQN